MPIKFDNPNPGVSRSTNDSMADLETAKSPQPAGRPNGRLASIGAGGIVNGPLSPRSPRRPARLALEPNLAEQQEIEANALSSVERMERLNKQQEEMALMTANMQAMAANRSEMLQVVRDMIKDMKDAMKDVGEAGHKPT